MSHPGPPKETLNPHRCVGPYGPLPLQILRVGGGQGGPLRRLLGPIAVGAGEVSFELSDLGSQGAAYHHHPFALHASTILSGKCPTRKIGDVFLLSQRRHPHTFSTGQRGKETGWVSKGADRPCRRSLGAPLPPTAVGYEERARDKRGDRARRAGESAVSVRRPSTVRENGDGSESLASAATAWEETRRRRRPRPQLTRQSDRIALEFDSTQPALHPPTDGTPFRTHAPGRCDGICNIIISHPAKFLEATTEKYERRSHGKLGDAHLERALAGPSEKVTKKEDFEFFGHFVLIKDFKQTRGETPRTPPVCGVGPAPSLSVGRSPRGPNSQKVPQSTRLVESFRFR